MLIAGIMTGTSLDAIDVAICDIQPKGSRHSVTLVYFFSAPYPDHVLELVKGALADATSVNSLAALQFELAHAFAAAVQQAESNARVQVEAVAVHGQTLWHEPPLCTWQAGNGAALSALLNRPVVHDFRSADVALGGQGAPLVPIFDYAMFANDVNRIALNIGGMANVTLLPAGCREDAVRAFDTGPGNVLINAVCKQSFGKHYDNGGRIARAGQVIPHALVTLRAHPFFAAEPPKSTGREIFGDEMASNLWRTYAHPSAPSEDLVTTLTELTAWSIADHIHRFMDDCTEIIVSGGGSYNTFLLERLASYLPTVKISTSTDYGVDVQAKEAMAFAYLGYRTLHDLHGNIPTVTGATKKVVLGSISRAV